MRSKQMCRWVVVLLVAFGSVDVALANELEFRSVGGSQFTTVQDPCPADQFPPIELDFEGFVDRFEGARTTIRCTTSALEGGKPKQGIEVELTGEVLNADGSTRYVLPIRTGTTNEAGQTAFSFPWAPGPGISMWGTLSGDESLTTFETDCRIAQRKPCVADDTKLCALGTRFKIQVDWRTSQSSGQGKVLESFSDGGLFYFFDPGDGDLLVQLLNACKEDNHFWVFATPRRDGDRTSVVEYELTVTDTMTGATKSYFNPLGQPAVPIVDTSAFATCP